MIRQYGDRTVISAYPDMSKVEFTEKQKQEQGRFQQAVAYARGILANPVKKKAYQKRLKGRRSVYHAALADFMRGEIYCI